MLNRSETNLMKDVDHVEVSLNLSQVKPLHAEWILEMYKCLEKSNDLVLNGFKEAGITEVVEKANEVFQRIENQFTAYRNEQNWKPIRSNA